MSRPSGAVIDEAIFKILRSEEVAVGAWIRLSTINRHWLLTGLRLADLVEGLARLDTCGYLYLESNGDDTFVIVRKSLPLFGRRRLQAMRLLRRTRLRPRNSESTVDRRGTTR